MRQSNLEEYIRSLIAENEIEEAIEQMAKKGYEVTLLRQRWTSLTNQMIFKTKSEESLDRKEAQIIVDILSILDGRDLDDPREVESEPDNLGQEQFLESPEAKDEPPLYEKWLKQLKNNPVIAVLLILFLVVAGAGQIAKSFGLNLFGPSTHTILIEGAVTDSLSQPIAQVRVKIMRGEKVLGSPITNPDGSFRYSIELEKASRLNFEFSKGDQTIMNRTVKVDVQLDTFVLPKPFIVVIPEQERQESQAQVNPPSAQPPAVPTTNKTFAIFF
ncbi:MAG: carboxypeptidase-like regulatory domain-containing protein [Bacteroidota bacterium]